MEKDKISYFTRRITQSNRTELIIVIYDMFLEYIKEAEACYQSEDQEGFSENTKKARDCMGSLMASLDTKYPISLELMQIYVYINKLLITSVIKKCPQDFDAIQRMIHNLRESFGVLAQNDNSAPLMGNTQQVYAGLTYGKGSLTESFSNQDDNRGFRI